MAKAHDGFFSEEYLAALNKPFKKRIADRAKKLAAARSRSAKKGAKTRARNAAAKKRFRGFGLFDD